MCYECGEKGHKANECPKKKNISKTGASGETAQNKRFYTKRNESILAGFSFHTSQVNSTCKNIELLIDSGYTSHMIKDAELFKDLNFSKIGKVECANGTESSIESRGSINLLPRQSRARSNLVT